MVRTVWGGLGVGGLSMVAMAGVVAGSVVVLFVAGNGRGATMAPLVIPDGERLRLPAGAYEYSAVEFGWDSTLCLADGDTRLETKRISSAGRARIERWRWQTQLVV